MSRYYCDGTQRCGPHNETNIITELKYITRERQVCIIVVMREVTTVKMSNKRGRRRRFQRYWPQQSTALCDRGRVRIPRTAAVPRERFVTVDRRSATPQRGVFAR